MKKTVTLNQKARLKNLLPRTHKMPRPNSNWLDWETTMMTRRRSSHTEFEIPQCIIPVVVALILNVTVAWYVDYVALMFKLVKISAIDLSTYLTDVEFG